jgi:two-component system response regulator FixJ
MKRGITVFVVDDEPSVRDSLRCLLDSAGFAVETFATAGEFLDAAVESRNGCLLLDLRMPGMDGLQLQERLAEREIFLPIIILTAHADVPTAVKALRAGAVDLVEKPYDDEDLIARIESAISHSVEIDWTESERAAIASKLAGLSNREREVLERIVAGKWVKAIARELGTSHNTVRNQRARILEKMGAESVADLVRMVMVDQLGGRRGIDGG